MPVNEYKLDEKTLKGKFPDVTGQIIFVNSATGNSNGDGTSLRPFSTLESAMNKSGLSAGDAIILMEGHAETISGAAGAAIDVAGVSVIGLGVGNKRPTFSFSATASTIVMTAASCSLRNIITKATVDSVVSCIVVSAAGCTIDVEHQDTSAAVEAVRVVLTTSAADNLTCNVVYKGFTAGNATVNTVRLVGVDNARVNVDFYGVVTTAIVEMTTPASTNVFVTGKFYTSGTTDLSKNVVDTVGGSTWSVDGFDAAAGANFSGGSGNAIAVGDLSAIASDVSTIKAQQAGTAGIASYPAAAAYANDVSIAEVLAYVQDGVRNGSGTAMASNKSVADALGTNGTTTVDSAVNLIGIIGSNTATTAFSSSSVVADLNGNVLERLEALQDPLGGYDPMLGFRVTKTSNMADGTGTDNLFTVTGRCLITHLSGEVTTQIGTTTTMKLTDVTNTVDLCAATTITSDVVGTMYALPGLSAQILNGTGGTPVVGSIPNMTIPSSGAGQIVGDVQGAITIAHVLDGAGTGAVAWVLYYKPLTAASSIVAAA